MYEKIFNFTHTIQCCGNLWHNIVNFWIVPWAQIRARLLLWWNAFAWNSWSLYTDAFCSNQWRRHIYHKHWTKLKLKLYLLIWSHFFRPLLLGCLRVDFVLDCEINENNFNLLICVQDCGAEAESSQVNVCYLSVVYRFNSQNFSKNMSLFDVFVFLVHLFLAQNHFIFCSLRFTIESGLKFNPISKWNSRKLVRFHEILL